jgi:alpha-D-ribose 1-methylphosphonate 5-phosphate C-P lyase
MTHSLDNRPLTDSATPFGFLDEFARREVRRSILKAIAIPGYQTPYASREMPMGRGFGTGGLQITLSIIGPADVLKVIDQGADDSVNAVSLKQFVGLTCPGVQTTVRTEDASIIQSRHRIPEHAMTADQVLVLQVPYPDPLVIVEPSEAKRKTMHGQADYARLLTKLYEDIVRFDETTISHRYPARVNGHYVIDPSPIPRYDLPRLHQAPFLTLLGAGREKKIYAVPPHTDVIPLAFDDVPFRVEHFVNESGQRRSCERCGSKHSFLDEFMDDAGIKHYRCSDSYWCDEQAKAKPASADEPAGELGHA